MNISRYPYSAHSEILQHKRRSRYLYIHSIHAEHYDIIVAILYTPAVFDAQFPIPAAVCGEGHHAPFAFLLLKIQQHITNAQFTPPFSRLYGFNSMRTSKKKEQEKYKYYKLIKNYRFSIKTY